MNGYRYRIEPGRKRGTWQYEITGPDGAAPCYGARVGRKAEVEAMLKRTCRRLNGGPIGIANHSPEEAQASRRRGARNGGSGRRSA